MLSPAGLSLSKASLLLAPDQKGREGFDKLSPAGNGRSARTDGVRKPPFADIQRVWQASRMGGVLGLKWGLAGFAAGAAIPVGLGLLMLRAQPCTALIWDRQGNEFLWQNLQAYQCSEASEKVAAAGTLLIGPSTNSFTSEDGKIRNAILRMSDEGIQQALDGQFSGGQRDGVRSYSVRIEGALFTADGRQEPHAWAIEPTVVRIAPNVR